MIKSENSRGAIFMSASMAGFVLNDVAIKLASTEISVYQSIFVRGCFATLLIGFVAWLNGVFKQLPQAADFKLIGWRSVFEVGATLCFLTALVKMPIANITAIMQALPLTVSLGAAWILGETFGWRRGVAIGIGLLAVLIIIRPGSDGFNIYSLLGVVAVLCVTFRDLIVRKFSKGLSSLFVSFVTASAITITGFFAMLLTTGWVAMALADIALLALASLLIFAGYYYSVSAMRHGDIAVVAPFRYTIMVWAILLGWLVWDEIPDTLTLIGITVVILMGAYTFWRESRAT